MDPLVRGEQRRQIAPWVLGEQRGAFIKALETLRGDRMPRDDEMWKRFYGIMEGRRDGLNDLEVFTALEQFYIAFLSSMGIYPQPETSRVSPDHVVELVKQWTFAMKLLNSDITVEDIQRFLEALPADVAEEEEQNLNEMFLPRGDGRPARFVFGSNLVTSLKDFENQYLKPLGIVSGELRFNEGFGPQQLQQLFAFWLFALEKKRA